MSSDGFSSIDSQASRVNFWMDINTNDNEYSNSVITSFEQPTIKVNPDSPLKPTDRDTGTGTSARSSVMNLNVQYEKSFSISPPKQSAQKVMAQQSNKMAIAKASAAQEKEMLNLKHQVRTLTKKLDRERIKHEQEKK